MTQRENNTLSHEFVNFSFELQIVPAARNQGIGEFLLQLLCHIGHHWNMEKVMLTVFKGAYYFLDFISYVIRKYDYLTHHCL